MHRGVTLRTDGVGGARRLRSGYVLLETVIATAILVLLLAVLGGQVQDSDTAVRRMKQQVEARHLAEQFLALLESRLIEFQSVDEVIEEEFGPRYPSHAWRVTLDSTIYEDLVQLRLDILYQRRTDWDEERFDFDRAEEVFTVYSLRVLPRPLNLADSFGMTDDELLELSDKFAGLDIPGLDPTNFDPSFLGKADFEDLIKALPTIMDAFGMDISQLMTMLPPEALEALKAAGIGPSSEGGDAGGGR